ncbi:MAG: hemerythrin domain-containing protein [Actinomycetota bacterium]
MSEPLEQMEAVTRPWCGRSWEGLVDRRFAASTQAHALSQATEQDAHQVVSRFLEFFNTTGLGLFRDEEEWIFRSLRPTPGVVLRAVEEHIEISSLITALVHDAEAGRADLSVIHGLGASLRGHLMFEELEIAPLVRDRPRLILTP